MKKLTKILLAFNISWGIIFSIFQWYIDDTINHNEHFDFPFTKEEYIGKGGTAVDYYLGYCFFTVHDGATRHGEIRPYLDISYTSISRVIYFLCYICLWTIGIKVLIKKDKSIGALKLGYQWLYIFITTAISLYGVYYSYVYTTRFWLE